MLTNKRVIILQYNKNKKNMINWINSWKAGNKKEKYELTFRLGTWTMFELMICPCAKCDNNKACPRFRFMLLNFGFEI